MLVLTRKIGESVVISEEVYCTVVGYRNGEVRLAFDAPKEVSVHREEIQRRIHRERQREGSFHEKTPNKESIVDRLISKFKHGKKTATTHQHNKNMGNLAP
jgi:carbon storage regulator